MGLKNLGSRILPPILRTLILLIACVFSGCINDDSPEPEGGMWSLQVGDRCPEFSVLTDKGDIVRNAAIKGRGAVIIFFNTSCSDCQRELPKMQQIYEQYLQDASSVQWVCIAREEDANSIAAYWEKHGLTMPYSPQTDRKIYNLFANSEIPRVYVISPECIITSTSL